MKRGSPFSKMVCSREIYIEREKEFALVGSIYKGRVTRVLPGMQSAFVDIGLDSDAFLYVGDFLENLEDYDHVVAPVEGKIEKMEQQGGAVFAPPAAPAAPGAPDEEPPASEVSPGNEAQPNSPAPPPSEGGVSPQPPASLHAPAAAISATGSPGTPRPRPRRNLATAAPPPTANDQGRGPVATSAVGVADAGGVVAAEAAGGFAAPPPDATFRHQSTLHRGPFTPRPPYQPADEPSFFFAPPADYTPVILPGEIARKI